MAIEFETPKPIAQIQYVLKTVAENMMRWQSREMDEHEHEIPFGYIEFMHTAMRSMGGGSLAPKEEKPKEGDEKKEKRPPIAYQSLAAQIEMLCWGDVGFYLITPGGGLGAAAVRAAGPPAALIARALDARENPDGLRASAADVERLASRFPLYAGRLVTSRA